MTETTSWTDHVMNGQTWLRFLYMLLLAPLLGCIGFMILCVALFQFFSVLASGESNPQLQALGRDLSRLAVDIVAFLTYNTENKPFGHADAAAAHGASEPYTEAKPAAGSAFDTAPDAASIVTTPDASKPADAARKRPSARKKKPAVRKTPRSDTRALSVAPGRDDSGSAEDESRADPRSD